MLKVFVDTDIIIDFSHSKNTFLADLLEKQSKKKLQLFINAIVIEEYFTDQKLENARLYNKAEDLIANFEVANINKIDGLLAAKFLREGLTFSVNDALIAASCEVQGMVLATRNKKHFSKISNLKFWS